MSYVILAAFVLLLYYEVWAIITHHLTLSQWTWRLSGRYPFIPFLFGLLMGHLFAR